MRFRFLFVPALLITVVRPVCAADVLKRSPKHDPAVPPRMIRFDGGVVDALGRSMARVEVTLESAGHKKISKVLTDASGKFEFSAPGPGTYAVVAVKPGFAMAAKVITLPFKPGSPPLVVAMSAHQQLMLPVVAKRLARYQNHLSDTGASDYTLTQRDIENLPQGQNTAFDDLLLQMPGVVRDVDQQIHIRGFMSNTQYRINGVMMPLDLYSGFGQVLTSRFIKSISLLDGVEPASYGYRNGGVIDIRSKDGCSDQGGDFTMYGGQRDTMRPAFQAGGCRGGLSYYVTGFYLQSALGLSQATPGPDPIHDFTNQGQGFSYLSYNLNPAARLSFIGGVSINNFQFPNSIGRVPQFNLYDVNPDSLNPALYPSTSINSALDQAYYFGVLALNGSIDAGLDYQLALTSRYNTVSYKADPKGELIYQGQASNVFHSNLSNTLQGDLTYRLWHSHTLGAGFYFGEYGVELDNHSLVFPANGDGQQTSSVPIGVVNNYNAINLLYGLYIQDTWRILPKVKANYGVRWDMMQAFGSSANQFSPRVNLLYEPDEKTALHAGYARYFQTPSFESITPRSFVAFANTTGAVPPVGGGLFPVAESDNYWDAGFVRQLLPHLALEEDAYYVQARQEIDTGQFGFVPIFLPFNWTNGRNYGSETSLTYNAGELAFRGNFTYSVAQGKNVSTGQFNLDPDELAYTRTHYANFDHDPRYAVSGVASYRWHGWLLTASGQYGSGLWAGFANTVNLPAYWQVDLGVAKKMFVPHLGESELRLAIVNLFDQVNLIRNGTGIGVFQSAYLPRRAFYGALTVPIPFI